MHKPPLLDTRCILMNRYLHNYINAPLGPQPKAGISFISPHTPPPPRPVPSRIDARHTNSNEDGVQPKAASELDNTKIPTSEGAVFYCSNNAVIRIIP